MATHSGTNGAVAQAEGSVLPVEARGILLVGRLQFAAQSSRNPKIFGLDVYAEDVDGRPSIEHVDGWVTDYDGKTTPFGSLVMAGMIGQLVGQDVVVGISVRASVNDKTGVVQVFKGVEAIWPLPALGGSAPASS